MLRELRFHAAGNSQRCRGPKTTRAGLRANHTERAKLPLPGLGFRVVGAPPGFCARSQRRRASRGASGSEL
eukprot:6085464-Alexandrium_andersonii.AAC.1